MKYFILYLFFMFSIDIGALILLKFGVENSSLYNLLSLVEFNLLFFFYRAVSKNTLTKKVSLINIILYNAIFVGTSIFLGKDVLSVTYNNLAPLFGAFQISIVLILFLREFLISEEILSYKKNILFWITVGLFMYYLGTLPLTGILSYMKKNDSFQFLYHIQKLLTIIMHSCFITGFLWSWNRVK
ncbi:hypothetical protein EV195_10461 [Tenacibaculum skagerrakense]|uniref:Uncharacterized protein n=1 Tax=Tenacibaculum skagerrakense TaxID=186571 RepID=A0A4R2NSZ3_9FLAO|nr:hypothetical protein [Tenacibaculum skagerrakense]TCP25030.1 hypothetical protein EV195_10461 [Tenacibaculum skagerrakense]